MAARLTDKKKKKIIADYMELGSYAATARKHKVSDRTVKAVVLADPETARKYEQKKEQNTTDILAHMEKRKRDVCIRGWVSDTFFSQAARKAASTSGFKSSGNRT